MSSDHTQVGADVEGSQPSAEVLALVGDDQTNEPAIAEEVTAESETVQTDANEEVDATPTEDDADDTKVDGEDDESKTDESPDTKDEEETAKTKQESVEFLIAGQKYTDMGKAIEAVNRISGANTQLAGQVNSLTNSLSQKDEAIKALEAKVKEWQDFYDLEGDEGVKPDKVDLDEKVRQVIQREKQAESEQQLKAQFQSELDSLPTEPDYSVVLPHMLQLANDMGDSVKNISPKTLYRMARGVAKGDESVEVLETAKKMAAHTSATELHKDKARKIVGGNAQKSPSIMRNNDVSPEVEAVLM